MEGLFAIGGGRQENLPDGFQRRGALDDELFLRLRTAVVDDRPSVHGLQVLSPVVLPEAANYRIQNKMPKGRLSTFRLAFCIGPESSRQACLVAHDSQKAIPRSCDVARPFRVARPVPGAVCTPGSSSSVRFPRAAAT
jgi:hypothetical protein